jgi:hypothetical protein
LALCRRSRASKRRDYTQIAKAVLVAATGYGPAILPPGVPPENDTRNPHAVALSKLGAFALFVLHYNFCNLHKTIRMTPAMEAGLSDHVWEIEDLLKLID